jgi:hypothetical protein
MNPAIIAFDAKRVATRTGAIDLNVVCVGICKYAGDGRLKVSTHNIFLRDQAAAVRVGFQSSRTFAKFFRESSVLVVSWAILGVYINGSGLRQGFDSGTAVVGEKYGVVHLRSNQTQTMAARRAASTATSLCAGNP